MPEITGKPSTRLEPTTTWTVVTDSPLKGLAFAREAGTILAWDEGNQLYLLNARGESLSTSRVPNRILTGAISDEGSLIALLVEADGAGLLALERRFRRQVRAARAVGGLVRDDRPARALSGGGNPPQRASFAQPLRPAGGAAGDDGAAVASLFRARPAALDRRGRVRHARGHRARTEPVSRQARSRNRLARPIDVQRRPPGPRRRGDHDPRQLLYPGHSAL